MKCALCKKEEATIHLTQVVDGSVKKVHLCEGCAAKSGFDVHSPMSITDILLGLGGPGDVGASSPKLTDLRCPRCHLRRIDFKKTGRLGCPTCYETFAEELEPVLKAMHRKTRHRGKVPARVESYYQTSERLEALSQELTLAIEQENYEDAARLRDEIKSLKSASAESAEEQ